MSDDTIEKRRCLSVPEAGKRYFGLGRCAAYEAAKRGDIPTLKVGGKLLVPIVAMERILNDCGKDTDS